MCVGTPLSKCPACLIGTPLLMSKPVLVNVRWTPLSKCPACLIGLSHYNAYRLLWRNSLGPLLSYLGKFSALLASLYRHVYIVLFRSLKSWKEGDWGLKGESSAKYSSISHETFLQYILTLLILANWAYVSVLLHFCMPKIVQTLNLN
jgi:hypothetical protein